MTKRANGKRVAPGQFHLPGGHIDSKESPPVALAREIKEELGIDIEVGDPFHVFSYFPPDESYTIGVVFFATPRDGLQEIKLNLNDNEAYAWIPLEIVDVYLPHHDHNYQAVVTGFQKLRQLRVE